MSSDTSPLSRYVEYIETLAGTLRQYARRVETLKWTLTQVVSWCRGGHPALRGEPSVDHPPSRWYRIVNPRPCARNPCIEPDGAMF